jgi:predicted outer membrane repeat protein
MLISSVASADAVVTGCSTDNDPAASVDFSKAMSIGGRVTFACPAGSIIRVTHRHIVNKTTTIEGGGSITLDAGGATSVFEITDPALDLRDITIRNAGYRKGLLADPTYGGVATGQGLVILERVTILDSLAAVNLWDGRVQLIDSRIEGGEDTALSAPNINVVRSRIVGPALAAVQGAIQKPGSPATVAGEIIIDHSEIAAGNSRVLEHCNALLVRGSTITDGLDTAIISGCKTTMISRSTFARNKGQKGGAIRLIGGAEVTVTGSHFNDNTATEGGAVALELSGHDTKIVFAGDTFARNQADRDGGAISLGSSEENDVTFQAHNLTFVENKAAGMGGAIFGTNARLDLSGAAFVGNSASSGGAIALRVLGDRPSRLGNVAMTRNRAAQGAAVFGASTEVSNATFSANLGGPAVAVWHVGGGPPTDAFLIGLRNTLLIGNEAGACEAPARLIVDRGHNLQFPDNHCGDTIPVADPGLDSLLIPAFQGPAMEAGDLAACLAAPVAGRDLFGRHRPQGRSCTIGAVEGTIEDLVAQRHPDFVDRLRQEGAVNPPSKGGVSGNDSGKGSGNPSGSGPPQPQVVNLPPVDTASSVSGGSGAPSGDLIARLRAVGIDFRVPEADIRDWVVNQFTPYPAFTGALLTLLKNTGLQKFVNIDAVACDYIRAVNCKFERPGVQWPHSVAEVDVNRLKAAILAAYNERYGEQVTNFENILR